MSGFLPFRMVAELYLVKDLNVKIKSVPEALTGEPASGHPSMLQA
jgi:hypothetical protein